MNDANMEQQEEQNLLVCDISDEEMKHLPILAEAEKTLLGIIALPGSQFAEPSERGAKRKVCRAARM
jgi:hypothetical protein